MPINLEILSKGWKGTGMALNPLNGVG